MRKSRLLIIFFIIMCLMMSVPAMAAESKAYPTVKSLANNENGVKVTIKQYEGATYYRIYRKTEGESWKKLADTKSLTYVDKSVKSGTTYYYTVRALDADKKTITGYDKKGKSIKYIAQPKISKLENAEKGVKITWGKSKGASSYRVFRKTEGGDWKKLADTTKTSYTDESAASGKKYYYTVRCLDKNGKYCSTYNKEGKSIKYYAPPKLSKAENVNGGVKVTWNKVSGAAEYRVFRKTGDGDWKKVADVTGTKYTDKSVKSGTKYVYTVRAMDKKGNYISFYNSKGKQITYVAAPAATVSVGTDGVEIKWAASKGSAKYRVFRKTEGGSWTKLGDTDKTSYTDKSGTKGTTYYYTVRCMDSSGKFISAYDTTGKKIVWDKKGSYSISDTGTDGSIYVLDIVNNKVHTTTCKHVKEIGENNRMLYIGALSAIYADGYSACKVCLAA